MESLKPSNPLNSRRQESGSEMPSSLPLSEPGPWNNAYASSIKETHTVELIGLPSLLFGGLNGLRRERDGREEVHSAKGVLA